MKSIMIAGIFSLTCASAIAADVKVTSFQYIEKPDFGTVSRNNTAEICGTATGAERVLVTVDPGANQGEYVALLSPNGKFCVVVNAVTGRATAEALVGANVVAKASASLAK